MELKLVQCYISSIMTRFFNPFYRVPRRIETPPWAEELIYQQRLTNKTLETLMPAIDDLKSAIADLGTQLTANNAEIDALLTKITTPGTSDADIATAVQSIRDLTAANVAEVDKAKAAAP